MAEDGSNPPGITGKFSNILEGGHQAPWRDLAETRFYTTVFIIKDGKILLGKKKRGFGLDYFLGFGGKVEPGETSHEAALRELHEEAGISAPIEHAGTLLFTKEGVDWNFHIDIYRAEAYEGDITEWVIWITCLNEATGHSSQLLKLHDRTEEMKPEWFDIDQVPYEKMWASDRHWLPKVISDTYHIGRTDFDENDELQKWWFALKDPTSQKQEHGEH